jgi:hypothetical protein
VLLFLDESGTDRIEAPYEVLAGVAIRERDLWDLIQQIREAELEHFGLRLAEVGVELKGKRLLRRKTFRHAAQGEPIIPARRRELVRGFLQKGYREAAGGPAEPRSRIRKDEATGQEWPHYGITYIDDLRPREEKDL